MGWSPPGFSVHGASPGKITGVGCHALLQGISPTQGSNPGLPHWGQIVYHLNHQGILATLPRWAPNDDASRSVNRGLCPAPAPLQRGADASPPRCLCRWRCGCRTSSWRGSSCACAATSKSWRSSRPATSTGGCSTTPPTSWRSGTSCPTSSATLPSPPPSVFLHPSSSSGSPRWTSTPAGFLCAEKPKTGRWGQNEGLGGGPGM